MVVGHSMGGKVAMVLALRHPELVAAAGASWTSRPETRRRRGRVPRYIDAMQRDGPGRAHRSRRRRAPSRSSCPNPGVRGFLLQNLRRDGDGWRWQANLDLFARDAARGPAGEIADWPHGR